MLWTTSWIVCERHSSDTRPLCYERGRFLFISAGLQSSTVNSSRSSTTLSHGPSCRDIYISGLLFGPTPVSCCIWREVACLLKGGCFQLKMPTVCQSHFRMKKGRLLIRRNSLEVIGCLFRRKTIVIVLCITPTAFASPTSVYQLLLYDWVLCVKSQEASHTG